MMRTQDKQPQTLTQAIRYFADEDKAHDFVVQMRWPNGPRCVHCQSENIGWIKSRKRFQCRDCRKQFSVRHNTIFEDSKISLGNWMCVVWMVANCRNGISSYEVARNIGVTQKSAWFMLQRIRLAMQTNSFMKLKGQVEVDETLIGGKARFMHKDRRKKFKGNTGSWGKTVVLGVLERGGHVRTEVIESTKRNILDPKVRKHVAKGANVLTDALPSYGSLSDEYIHETIDHAQTYVRDHVHTNSLENYWSLVKRAIRGTYVSVEPFHLFRYLDEQAYRYNNRKLSDRERFTGVTRMVAGRRLTYAKLTARG